MSGYPQSNITLAQRLRSKEVTKSSNELEKPIGAEHQSLKVLSVVEKQVPQKPVPSKASSTDTKKKSLKKPPRQQQQQSWEGSSTVEKQVPQQPVPSKAPSTDTKKKSSRSSRQHQQQTPPPPSSLSSSQVPVQPEHMSTPHRDSIRERSPPKSVSRDLQNQSSKQLNLSGSASSRRTKHDRRVNQEKNRSTAAAQPPPPDLSAAPSLPSLQESNTTPEGTQRPLCLNYLSALTRKQKAPSPKQARNESEDKRQTATNTPVPTQVAEPKEPSTPREDTVTITVQDDTEEVQRSPKVPERTIASADALPAFRSTPPTPEGIDNLKTEKTARTTHSFMTAVSESSSFTKFASLATLSGVIEDGVVSSVMADTHPYTFIAYDETKPARDRIASSEERTQLGLMATSTTEHTPQPLTNVEASRFASSIVSFEKLGHASLLCGNILFTLQCSNPIASPPPPPGGKIQTSNEVSESTGSFGQPRPHAVPYQHSRGSAGNKSGTVSLNHSPIGSFASEKMIPMLSSTGAVDDSSPYLSDRSPPIHRVDGSGGEGMVDEYWGLTNGPLRSSPVPMEPPQQHQFLPMGYPRQQPYPTHYKQLQRLNQYGLPSISSPFSAQPLQTSQSSFELSYPPPSQDIQGHTMAEGRSHQPNSPGHMHGVPQYHHHYHPPSQRIRGRAGYPSVAPPQGNGGYDYRVGNTKPQYQYNPTHLAGPVPPLPPPPSHHHQQQPGYQHHNSSYMGGPDHYSRPYINQMTSPVSRTMGMSRTTSNNQIDPHSIQPYDSDNGQQQERPNFSNMNRGRGRSQPAFPSITSSSLHQQQPSSSLHQRQPSSSLHQRQPSSSLHQRQPSSPLHQQQPSSSLHQQQPSSSLHQQQPSSSSALRARYTRDPYHLTSTQPPPPPQQQHHYRPPHYSQHRGTATGGSSSGDHHHQQQYPSYSSHGDYQHLPVTSSSQPSYPSSGQYSYSPINDYYTPPPPHHQHPQYPQYPQHQQHSSQTPEYGLSPHPPPTDPTGGYGLHNQYPHPYAKQPY